MIELRPRSEWPFAVVALAQGHRAVIIEPTIEHASRRMRRLLLQAGADHFAADLPTSRTPFAIEQKDSHSVQLRDFDLTISLGWLRLRSRDSAWPDPVIVARLGRGQSLVTPTLAPDRARAHSWVERLKQQRGVAPAQILELPAVDRRSAGTYGRFVPTMDDVLNRHTLVEEVVRTAISGETIERAA